jgi:hypothetical protein
MIKWKYRFVFAPGIAADTGPWLRPVQYERIARPGAQMDLCLLSEPGFIGL